MTEKYLQNKIEDRILAFSLDNGYRYLLISLILTLLAYPIISEYEVGRFLVNIFVTFLLITSLMAAVKTRRALRISFVLVLLLLVARWTESVTNAPSLVFFSLIVSTLFWIYVVAEILIDIFFYRKAITSDMIFGSLSAYMLIGVVFAFLFALVDLFIPGSFDGMNANIEGIGGGSLQRYIYFSFVTMATLGYGDILPVQPAAQALSYMEALLGQIYLTVLVARLVGMYISHKEG